MIQTILIDDEKNCLTALQNDLAMFCPPVQVADACQSAKDGLLSIKKHNPQLIFLDVEMPWMNGFEMLEVLGKDIPFQIIFTTAHDRFAVQAFKVSAIDYLLKPIDSSDLIAAVDKAAKAIAAKEDTGNISNLLYNAGVPPEQKKIAVPHKDGYMFIEIRHIIYCKATGAYTELVLDNHRKILLSRSLGETEDLLPAGLFERIHHSLLINMQHIYQYRKSQGSVIVMSNGEELAVSKSRKESLFKRLGIR